MTIDIQEEDERIKRFIVAVDGEQVTLSYVEGSQVAALAYAGFHGNAQVSIPLASIGVVEGLLAKLKAFLEPPVEPEPEELPVDPEPEPEPDPTPPE